MSENTQARFAALAARLCGRLNKSEVLLLNLHAENSDFVRFNHGRIRQAGAVSQHRLSLELVEDQRHARGHVELCGDITRDQERLAELLCTLRAQCGALPPDPFAGYASEAPSTQDDDRVQPPDAHHAAESLARACSGLDLVGLLASGDIEVGFANSLGQLNWHRRAGFNVDWSCHLADGKAVKCAYAGARWDPEQLEQRLAAARRQLDALKQPSVTVSPGSYRAYLAPQALLEILDIIAWDGFGLLSQRTRRTPLIKLLDERCVLDPSVVLRENHAGSLAPGFTSQGFAKAPGITLVEGGRLGQALVGPRSSKEFGVPVNDDSERPESLELLPGRIPGHEVLERLGTGLYINNAWYCNLSDRADCRVTGMTRFACYWVERGELRGPLDVMRFDVSLYDLLGKNLVGLTQKSQLIQDPSSYQQRSLLTARLPGALVENFRLTL